MRCEGRELLSHRAVGDTEDSKHDHHDAEDEAAEEEKEEGAVKEGERLLLLLLLLLLLPGLPVHLLQPGGSKVRWSGGARDDVVGGSPQPVVRSGPGASHCPGLSRHGNLQ